MLNFSRLEVQVMNDEGFRDKPYLDTRGVPTIGYGTTHIYGRPVTLGDSPVTKEQARLWLRGELYGACIAAQKIVPRFNRLSYVRREVLANMVYNLGASGLAGFKRMLAAIKRKDYKAAADEMVDSAWYTQVGQRSQRLEAAMRSGKWSGA